MSKKRLYNAWRLKDITASMGKRAVEKLGVLDWENGSTSTGVKMGVSYSKSARSFPQNRLYPRGLRLDLTATPPRRHSTTIAMPSDYEGMVAKPTKDPESSPESKM